MHQLLTLMEQNGGVFSLHPYPYFVANGDSSLLTASLDADIMMQNQYDSCVAAMSKLGFSNIPIIITETGWATAGSAVASVENAEAYVNSLTSSQLVSQTDIYVFEFFDEANKSGAGDEPNFGWYTEGGQKKYDITAAGTPPPVTLVSAPAATSELSSNSGTGEESSISIIVISVSIVAFLCCIIIICRYVVCSGTTEGKKPETEDNDGVVIHKQIQIHKPEHTALPVPGSPTRSISPTASVTHYEDVLTMARRYSEERRRPELYEENSNGI